MSITLDMVCKKCGTTLRREMFMALMVDMGAQTSLDEALKKLAKDPCLCPAGDEHEFVDAEEALKALNKAGEIT